MSSRSSDFAESFHVLFCVVELVYSEVNFVLLCCLFFPISQNDFQNTNLFLCAVDIAQHTYKWQPALHAPFKGTK